MNSTWMKWTLAGALSVGTLGCATGNHEPLHEFAQAPPVESATQESRAAADTASKSNSLQFASAQMPRHDMHDMHQLPSAGHEFQPPPPVPTEPAAVLLNQQQAFAN